MKLDIRDKPWLLEVDKIERHVKWQALELEAFSMLLLLSQCHVRLVISGEGVSCEQSAHNVT